MEANNKPWQTIPETRETRKAKAKEERLAQARTHHRAGQRSTNARPEDLLFRFAALGQNCNTSFTCSVPSCQLAGTEPGMPPGAPTFPDEEWGVKRSLGIPACLIQQSHHLSGPALHPKTRGVPQEDLAG
ncbi:UNVERIFIED_CONTAM: hypothetical protein K2H54_015977 [Gekko kuhli]